jgi:hypothetical protein
MHVDGLLVALRTTNNVGLAITVQVDEDGVLDRTNHADLHGRPGLLDLNRAGVEVDRDDAALFPWHDEIHPAVAVKVP